MSWSSHSFPKFRIFEPTIASHLCLFSFENQENSVFGKPWGDRYGLGFRKTCSEQLKSQLFLLICDLKGLAVNVSA